jgi:tRNA (mo5U34)-methyltransferase
MASTMHRPPMGRDDIEARVRELGTWFHNLDLKGVRTAPEHFLGDYPQVKWQRFASSIPEDLTGKTVLDIGCNAGFYSIEMKRRGAARVVGIDSSDVYLAQARFAADVLGVDIDFKKLKVWDVAALGEKFDLVIFMGVLYHLRHPLLALDLIRDSVAKDLLLFQSMQRGSEELFKPEADYPFSETEIFEKPEFPRMYFIENKYSNDQTNWWVPNRSCSEAMLRSAGFEVLANPEPEVFLCKVVGMWDLPDGPRAVYPAKPRGELHG